MASTVHVSSVLTIPRWSAFAYRRRHSRRLHHSSACGASPQSSCRFGQPRPYAQAEASRVEGRSGAIRCQRRSMRRHVGEPGPTEQARSATIFATRKALPRGSSTSRVVSSGRAQTVGLTRSVHAAQEPRPLHNRRVAPAVHSWPVPVRGARFKCSAKPRSSSASQSSSPVLI